METICILGMHRSGTSLLANIVRQLGIDLGPERDIMEPSKSDNPEGYWENIHFVEVNDKILAALGGSWDEIPSMEPGWSNDPRLQECRSEAEGIAWTLSNRGQWGWKDPRTTATIELWQSVIPNIRYLILVRNPIEVAMSLGKRQGYSVEFDRAIELWRDYYNVMLQTVDPDNSLVLHYDSLQGNTQAEIERIADYLGVALTEEMLEKAKSVIKPSLHRNVFPRVLEDALPLDRATMRTYGFLCSKCGAKYQELQKDSEQSTDQITSKASELLQVMLKGYADVREDTRKKVAQINHSRHEASQEAKRRTHDLQRATQLNEELQSRLAAVKQHMESQIHIAKLETKEHDKILNEQLDSLRSYLEEHKTYVETLKSQMSQKDARIQELLAHIQEMQNSLSWKVTRPLRAIRSIGK